MIDNNNSAYRNAINNEKSASSDAEENLKSQFDGRSVEVGQNRVSRGGDRVEMALFSPRSIGSCNKENVTFLKEKDAGGLIKKYMQLYSSCSFGYYLNYLLLNVGGSWEANGGLSGILSQSIYDRLSKIGLFVKDIRGEPRKNIALPVLKASNFDIMDDFGWFCENFTVKEKLNKIAEGFKIMLLLEQIFSEKLEQADVVVKVVTSNSKDRRERVQAKLNGLEVGLKICEEDKKTALFCLRASRSVWQHMPCDTFHPSKIYAYMLFEGMLSYTLHIFKTAKAGSSNMHSDYVIDYMERVLRILVESLELLLPYAVEITKAFEIDLVSDSEFSNIRSVVKTMVSHLSIDEYKEYQDLEVEVAEIEKVSEPSKTPKLSKKARARARKRDAALLAGTVSVKKDESISLSQSQQEVEEVNRQKQIEVNRAVMAARARKVQEEREDAERERHIRGKEKVKELKDRKVNVAQTVANKHKEEEAKKQEAKTKARLESQYKIHDLPSEDFVQNTIIANLSANDILVMETVFGELDYDYTISHKNAVNLAKNIKKVLDDHNIGCAKDFYNNLIARIHYVHDPDKGDLLPRHYVDILRACFVIFRIWLKGWEPKTKEDFDAMEKCLQRQADAFYAKMSQ